MSLTDLTIAAAREGLQQRRNPDALADDYGNQLFRFFDPGMGEGAHLRLHPPAFPGMLGKGDYPCIRLIEPLIDAGDDVVAGADFPFIEPRVDAALSQRGREGFNRGLVFRGVAEENPQGSAPR